MTQRNNCMCGICSLLTECPKGGEWRQCRLNADLTRVPELERLAERGAALEYMATQNVGFKRLDEAVITGWTEKYKKIIMERCTENKNGRLI